jgi:predicted DNA-binding protein (MmcQ/YjbR family)
MPNLTAPVVEILEQVRQLALSYDGAEEYFPWGYHAFFRDIKGCNFLLLDAKPDYLEITVRLPQATRTKILAEQIFSIELNKSLGYKGWINVRVSQPSELEPVVAWIELSYRLNKPIRTSEDLVEGEVPHSLECLIQLRQAIMTYGDIEEFFPYGDRAFRRRKGQIFLYTSERDETFYASVRLPMGVHEHALSLPFTEVPKYIGPKGWVSARIDSQTELDTVLGWLELSYDMNKPKRSSTNKNKIKNTKNITIGD